jgi:hypothetical protein
MEGIEKGKEPRIARIVPRINAPGSNAASAVNRQKIVRNSQEFPESFPVG